MLKNIDGRVCVHVSLLSDQEEEQGLANVVVIDQAIIYKVIRMRVRHICNRFIIKLCTRALIEFRESRFIPCPAGIEKHTLYVV